MRSGAIANSAAAYRQAADFMRQYAIYTSDKTVKKERLRRAAMHLEMAEKLGALPQTSNLSPKLIASPASESGPDVDYETEVLQMIEESRIRWDDIGGLETTKQDIKIAFGLAMARKPKGVHIEAWRNLLLFGPPGTGKTLLAAATAGSLDATFFNVKVSSVLSKYFGESSKLLSALYATARRLSPVVIFLDEFEALTPARGEGESGAERRIVSTLLAELDGLTSKNEDKYVLTIGATNLPWMLDDAILSRFQKRIFVPLPDPETRQKILEIHLKRRGHKSSLSDEEMVRRTEGYSGREIEQVCQSAITSMTQRANPDLMAIVDKGQSALKNYVIKVKPLNDQDFAQAFGQVKPATNKKILRRHLDWQSKSES